MLLIPPHPSLYSSPELPALDCPMLAREQSFYTYQNIVRFAQYERAPSKPNEFFGKANTIDQMLNLNKRDLAQYKTLLFEQLEYILTD